MTWIAASRGDIFLVDTGARVGAEINKIRPCLIIQNNYGNMSSPVTIVAMIKSDKGGPPFPGNVSISAKETGLSNDSFVLPNQIYTVDKSRLIKKIGRVPDKKMKLVDQALILSLDLDYF